MEERKDHLWKVADEVEQRIDDLDKSTYPMGLEGRAPGSSLRPASAN